MIILKFYVVVSIYVQVAHPVVSVGKINGRNPQPEIHTGMITSGTNFTDTENRETEFGSVIIIIIIIIIIV